MVPARESPTREIRGSHLKPRNETRESFPTRRLMKASFKERRSSGSMDSPLSVEEYGAGASDTKVLDAILREGASDTERNVIFMPSTSTGLGGCLLAC